MIWHNALPCAGATDCRGGSRSSRNISTPPIGKTTGRLDTTSPRRSPSRSIRQHPKEPVRHDLSLMRWGLIPAWAKDASGAAKMINARSETARTKPAFRDPLKYRRCLIPADAFYEWKRNGTSKQPYCFEVNDGEIVRVRRTVGRLEEYRGAMDQNLLDSDHHAECRDLQRPRPNASDSRQGRL